MRRGMIVLAMLAAALACAGAQALAAIDAVPGLQPGSILVLTIKGEASGGQVWGTGAWRSSPFGGRAPGSGFSPERFGAPEEDHVQPVHGELQAPGLVALHGFGVARRATLYNVVWILVCLLMAASVACTFSRQAPRVASRRPRLLLRRKFRLFYGLELFYGARKQIFLTFAPFVLIREYGADTSHMALLMGVSAAINMFAGPWIGMLTDRIGYRTVMVYDTFVLVFVCLLYGFAGDWFPRPIAFWIVCATFLLDALISTTSLATNLYVRDIADGRDEVTATLSTGISINHFISVLAAPLGGWIWMRWGVGTLFAFSALMSIANSFCAMQIPLRRRA